MKKILLALLVGFPLLSLVLGGTTVSLFIYDDPSGFEGSCTTVNEIDEQILDADGTCHPIGALFYVIGDAFSSDNGIQTITFLERCDCEILDVPCGATVYNDSCVIEQTTGTNCQFFNDGDGLRTALGGAGNGYALETACTCIEIDGCTGNNFDGSKRDSSETDGTNSRAARVNPVNFHARASRALCGTRQNIV